MSSFLFHSAGSRMWAEYLFFLRKLPKAESQVSESQFTNRGRVSTFQNLEITCLTPGKSARLS
ncbi:Hypothetical predicted protein [Podarcis lilfordi]|uniref:Uncharacterized protein n=2 Tax=Podarcis lilfordi TaxID=74358 RepID=A0AA35P2H6_9SAUR|nr:Hypothetical predicted protein [Podarcis lilfordi]